VAQDITCPQCGQTIRVPEVATGMRIKCPQCAQRFRVRPTGSQETATRDWYVRTSDGKQYGPVRRDELDRWAAEGRVDERCQVLNASWPQWQWADAVLRQLRIAGEGSAESLAADAAASLKSPPAEPPAPLGSEPGPPVAGPTPPERTAGAFELGAERAAIELAAGPMIRATPTEPGTFSHPPGWQRTLLESLPWVLTMALTQFALFGIAMVGMLFTMIRAAAAGPWIVIGVAGLAAAVAVLLVPGCLLIGYHRVIRRYAARPEHRMLERVLEAHRRWWKVVAIGWLVAILLALLILLARPAKGANRRGAVLSEAVPTLRFPCPNTTKTSVIGFSHGPISAFD
jgi:phage FluMu protein Com